MKKTVCLKLKEQVLISRLEIADSFFSRAKGLLGTQALPTEQGLWIYHCNSIHTFFMKYAIDCVFVNKNMVVKKIYLNVKPWRMTWPAWGSDSVIEVAGGEVSKWNLKVGDQLYVGN